MQKCRSFNFENNEISAINVKLLNWYHKNKREMPWRKVSPRENEDKNQHAYNVWVSEIMLQQTRVDTVISFYNK